MKCKFPDRDLSQRLDATICRYRGFPYYVRIPGGNMVTLYSLASGGKKAVHEIRPNDEDFDISTVPLGYVQLTPDVVAYSSRRPNRLYKQGLSNDSVSWKYLTPRNQHVIGATMFTQNFENMILGVYPDMRQALDILRKSERDREVAISRDVALKYNPNLKIIVVYFKGEEVEVGWIIPDTDIVIVPSSERGWIVSKHLSGFSWEIR